MLAGWVGGENEEEMDLIWFERWGSRGVDDECSGGGRDNFLDFGGWAKIRLGVDYIYGKEGSWIIRSKSAG